MNASLNRILTSTFHRKFGDAGGGWARIIRATTNINDRGSVGEKWLPWLRYEPQWSPLWWIQRPAGVQYRAVDPITDRGYRFRNPLFTEQSWVKIQWSQYDSGHFLTASLIAAVISIIVALLVSRSITQPIGMREQAIRIAKEIIAARSLFMERWIGATGGDL